LRQTPAVEVEFNESFGTALSAAIERARQRGLVDGTLTPGDLLRLPQALTIRERRTDADETAEQALADRASDAVSESLMDLDAMRKREGEHLRVDLDQRRAFVADLVEQIARAADEGRAAMERRLAERVRELRADLEADEAAVAQEIVRMAARSDISEEGARVRGHGAHWAALGRRPEPCGRKPDLPPQGQDLEGHT